MIRTADTGTDAVVGVRRAAAATVAAPAARPPISTHDDDFTDTLLENAAAPSDAATAVPVAGVTGDADVRGDPVRTFQQRLDVHQQPAGRAHRDLQWWNRGGQGGRRYQPTATQLTWAVDPTGGVFPELSRST